MKFSKAITLRRLSWLMVAFVSFHSVVLMIVQYRQLEETIHYETTAPIESALLSAELPAAMSIEFLDRAFSDKVLQSLMATGFFARVSVVDDFGETQSTAERPLNESFWVISP